MVLDGIDISQFQDIAIAGGDWLFVVSKLTEGTWVSNPKYEAQMAAVRPGVLKGAYHYARPGKSDGATQAHYFSQQVLARGFKPGVDLWQLDVEGYANAGVGPAQWETFVNAFMASAIGSLGARGFLYVGGYFLPGDVTARLTSAWNWWDPNYGNNDGTAHPLPAGVDPVLQQYTSHAGLDRNRVYDVAKWARIVGALPSPSPAPSPAPVTIHIGGDVMDVTSVSVVMDGTGKGWHPTTIPWAKFAAATPQGSDPEVDGYWPVPKVGVQNRNGCVFLEVVDGPPSKDAAHPVSVTVFVAHAA